MLHASDPTQALSWVIQDIHAKGWATGTGGNFSMVVQRDPLRLLMAPSGVDKGLVQPEDLIEVDGQGVVVAGSGKASAETLVHLQLAQDLQAGAILHTHSVFNTLLSEYFLDQGQLTLSGYEMLKGLEGIKTHETVVQVPIFPNSQDMALVSQWVGDRFSHLSPRSSSSQNLSSTDPTHSSPNEPCPYGFLLASHGLYSWGATLFQARRHLEILEFFMELTYRKLNLPN
jgi:methylthioribulose-1-phosphate dehydratase